MNHRQEVLAKFSFKTISYEIIRRTLNKRRRQKGNNSIQIGYSEKGTSRITVLCLNNIQAQNLDLETFGVKGGINTFNISGSNAGILELWLAFILGHLQQ
ncbi:MAG: hypothetical protein ACR2MX_14730 [Cyclobacteriaceae bacterium]